MDVTGAQQILALAASCYIAANHLNGRPIGKLFGKPENLVGKPLKVKGLWEKH
jgi:hypothetical protein